MTDSAASSSARPRSKRSPAGRCAPSVFHESGHPLGAHIELAERAELLCVAPATANYLAKAAHGLADDLLSTLTLSFAGQVVVAPAMNCEMWAKPAVQRNVEQLRRDGFVIVDPEEGWLSCRRQGAGRMASPETDPGDRRAEQLK